MKIELESVVYCPKWNELVATVWCERCLFQKEIEHDSSMKVLSVECTWEEEGEPLLERAKREICSKCIDNKVGKSECHEFPNRLNCPKIGMQMTYLIARRGGLVEKRNDVQSTFG